MKQNRNTSDINRSGKDRKIFLDIIMLSSALLSVFALLSLITHSVRDPSFSSIIFVKYQDKVDNAFGKIGAYFSDVMGTVFGTPILLLPILLIYTTILIFKANRGLEKKSSTVVTFVYGVLIIVCLSILFGLIGKLDPYFPTKPSGGMLGVIASSLIVSTIGSVGGVITFIILLIILFMLLFKISFTDAGKFIYNNIKFAVQAILSFINSKIDKNIKEDSSVNEQTVVSSYATLGTIQSGVSQLPIPYENSHTINTIIDDKVDTSIEDIIEPTDDTKLDNNTAITFENKEDKGKELVFIKEKIIEDDITPIKQTIEDYHIPTDILDIQKNIVEEDSEADMKLKADQLVQKLADFGVNGHVRAIYPGPVVTMFEYEPAAGTRVSKIATLENDLALSMSALSIRIIAPIPGKNAVGIEIPNKNRASVFIKELLERKEFATEKSPLTVVLGKDAVGRVFVTDIAKMPHLLVAGTTGSGKSVGLNTIICSILYKASPDVVKFIMVDPKMVELSIYNGIPHLNNAVITDPKQASNVLKNIALKMDERYALLAEKRVRNIEGYNELANTDSSIKKLPYIIVVVDEFADLMMIAGKEVEFSITRIAQKARAVGIHLIIATQRPTANVITGLIKSNMPARIAFKVSQKNDSRVILDQNGADMLLGRGDSLFMPPGSSDLIRIHGAFVSDNEVRNIVEYLRKYGEPVFDDEILKEIREDSASSDNLQSSDEKDEKYEEALAVVYDKGQASISLIQRYLKIGYNRAARIVDMMEQEGIIAQSDGTARPREILKK